MKKRLRLWLIALGILCALTSVGLYLGRPSNELAAFLKLHPSVASTRPPHRRIADSFYTQFNLSQSAEAVAAALPGEHHFASPTVLLRPGASCQITLPSGRWATIWLRPGATSKDPGCSVTICGYEEAWYNRAWNAVATRVGL